MMDEYSDYCSNQLNDQFDCLLLVDHSEMNVSTYVVEDHNFVETLCHISYNWMVLYRYVLIDVFSNLIVGWNHVHIDDIYVDYSLGEEFDGRPMYVIGKSLYHIPYIWMVSLLNEYIYFWK